MTSPNTAIAQLLWGGQSGATAAQYQVPVSVIAAAQQTGSMGGAFNVGGLLAYLSPSGSVGGYPALNQSQPSAAVNWTGSGGSVALNSAPPAGCPIGSCMQFTPSGSSTNPLMFGPGLMPCYPNVNYTVSSTLRPAAATGSPLLTVGIAWFNQADTQILEETVFVASSLTVAAWNPISCSFTAPAGAFGAAPFAGWTGSAVAAADVMSIAGLFISTPYS